MRERRVSVDSLLKRLRKWKRELMTNEFGFASIAPQIIGSLLDELVRRRRR